MHPTMILVTMDSAPSPISNNPCAQPIAGPSGSQPLSQTSYISEVTLDVGRSQSDSSDDASDEAPTGKGKQVLVRFQPKPKQALVRSRSKVCRYFSLSPLGLTKTSRIFHQLNGLRYPTLVAKLLSMYVCHWSLLSYCSTLVSFTTR